MARSNRTGVARAPARQAAPPAKPSVPQSTMPTRGAAPPPAAPMSAPPPAAAPGGGGGMMSGIMGTVVQGMAFGTGSAVANRAVDSVMGPRQVEHVHSGQPEAAPQAAAAGGPQACQNEFASFQDCLKNSNGDITPCQFYMDMLTQCKKSYA